MASFAIFKPPELTKKLSELKLFFEIELGKLISSMGYETFLLKTYFSIGEKRLI